MSQSIPLSRLFPILPMIRQTLREIKHYRGLRDYCCADVARDNLLKLDNGMKITQDPSGRVTLWHWPNPPFTDQFHYANYGEFIANSEEEIWPCTIAWEEQGFLLIPKPGEHEHVWSIWRYHHNGGGEFENNWRECMICGLIEKKYSRSGTICS